VAEQGTSWRFPRALGLAASKSAAIPIHYDGVRIIVGMGMHRSSIRAHGNRSR
jgi:hypothetical protein